MHAAKSLKKRLGSRAELAVRRRCWQLGLVPISQTADHSTRRKCHTPRYTDFHELSRDSSHFHKRDSQAGYSRSSNSAGHGTPNQQAPPISNSGHPLLRLLRPNADRLKSPQLMSIVRTGWSAIKSSHHLRVVCVGRTPRILVALAGKPESLACSERFLQWSIKSKQPGEPWPNDEVTSLYYANQALQTDGICNCRFWSYQHIVIPNNPGQGGPGAPSAQPSPTPPRDLSQERTRTRLKSMVVRPSPSTTSLQHNRGPWPFLSASSAMPTLS